MCVRVCVFRKWPMRRTRYVTVRTKTTTVWRPTTSTCANRTSATVSQSVHSNHSFASSSCLHSSPLSSYCMWTVQGRHRLYKESVCVCHVRAWLTLWRPLLPYGYMNSTKSGWASECPDAKNYKWRLTRSGTGCFIAAVPIWQLLAS